MLNRASGRSTIFEDASDFSAFAAVLSEACERFQMRLLGYCIMPNHWHLLVWPESGHQLSEFMQWLTLTHTARWHRHHDSVGTGPLYQGRYKAIPIQAEPLHFWRVLRYIERNALRSRLVAKAEEWRWGSLWARVSDCFDVPLAALPFVQPDNWIQQVNLPDTLEELVGVRTSVEKGMPYGDAKWSRQTADRLGLKLTVRGPGRPRKHPKIEPDPLFTRCSG